jgi:hypothetical protein
MGRSIVVVASFTQLGLPMLIRACLAYFFLNTCGISNRFCQPNRYVDPKGTVHITEGNGGVPGVAGTNTVKDCKTAYGRKCGTGGAYGRFITSNATVLS